LTVVKSPEKGRDEYRQLQLRLSSSLDGPAAPGRVLLAPCGGVETTNGSFIVDEESARLVRQALTDHGTDLPIDYEHQTLGGTYASPNGQAPAAGWIKQLHFEPGVGLLAEIEWTDQARKMIAAKEYRYLSPVAIIRKSDRKLVAIHSAALTNKPAIRGMQPIVNRDPFGDNGALDRLRQQLDIDDEADAVEVIAAASRRLTELDEARTRQHMRQRIADAVRAGKLVESQRSWAETLIARDEQLFNDWIESAPVVVMPGKTAAPAASETGNRGAADGARAEFRANPILARMTTEDAYVAAELRMQN
jgi:phage I-like protein